jgi:hypothetical protein
MSKGSARQEWAGHVREALKALPGLEAQVQRLGYEGGEVSAWVKALCAANLLLEEQTERLARADLGLSWVELPRASTRCAGRGAGDFPTRERPRGLASS